MKPVMRREACEVGFKTDGQWGILVMLYFPSSTPADLAALRDTAAYIYSTFPIVEREDTAAHGRCLSRDLCLA